MEAGRNRAHGFTAIELAIVFVVVIGIVLAALLYFDRRQKQRIQTLADADPHAVFEFNLQPGPEAIQARDKFNLICTVKNPTRYDLGFTWEFLAIDLGASAFDPSGSDRASIISLFPGSGGAPSRRAPEFVAWFDPDNVPTDGTEHFATGLRRHTIPAKGAAHFRLVWRGVVTASRIEHEVETAAKEGTLTVVTSNYETLAGPAQNALIRRGFAR